LDFDSADTVIRNLVREQGEWSLILAATNTNVSIFPLAKYTTNKNKT
jgi:hypothetical protein